MPAATSRAPTRTEMEGRYLIVSDPYIPAA